MRFFVKKALLLQVASRFHLVAFGISRGVAFYNDLLKMQQKN